MNMEVHQTAAAIVLFEGDVLLMKRARPPYKGSWEVPGGHVEENELPVQAAVRELREETGCVIRLLDYEDDANKAFPNTLPVKKPDLIELNEVREHKNAEKGYYVYHYASVYVFNASSKELGPVSDHDEESSVKWVKLQDLKDVDLTPYAKDYLIKTNLFPKEVK